MKNFSLIRKDAIGKMLKRLREISEKKEALKKYALDSKQISEAELDTDGF